MSNPLNTIEVLRAEAKEIHGADLSHIPDDKLALALNDLGSTALCLSGGGIRSAVFALGIIQALAQRPRKCKDNSQPPADKALLGQFNYLSTVSGGGYIGGWLSAWLSRQPYADVVKLLNGREGGVNGIEPTPIGDLRRDSNYLTPKVGLLSADTWAAAAIVLRNLLLNWVLLIPLLLLSLVALKLGAIGLAWLPHAFGEASSGLALAVLVAASLIFVIIGLRFTLSSLRRTGPASVSQLDFLIGNMLPMVLAGIAWTCAVDTLIGYQLLIVSPLGDLLVVSALVGALVYGLAQIVTLFTTGEIFSRLVHWGEWHDVTWRRKVVGWLAAGAVYGAFLSLGAKLLGSSGDVPLRIVLLFLFGPPWLLLSQLMAETCYVAATSANPGSDEQREWLARSAGWYLAVSAFWTAGVAFALLGSWAAGQAQLGFDRVLGWLSSAGVATGLIGWLTGGSGRTPAQGPAKSLSGLLFDVAARLAAPLFFALLLVISSALLDLWVLGESLLGYLLSYGGFPTPPDSLGSEIFQTSIDPAERWMAAPEFLGAAILLTAIAYLASKYININRFSLHGLYRNRLVRAFLGASHLGRKPDHFTGFDEDDNVAMKDLWPEKPEERTGKHWRPFHVLTLTLNLVSTRDLAWQQRKAMPFTVSPLHCGAAFLGPLLDQPGGILSGYRGAYRPSAEYGGSNKKHDQNNPGISLGTAMAISGAAVNPNMGYHSSPAVSLLLTLLNFRLGWWLGNPAPAGDGTWYRNGPPRAALPLIMDAFGLSTDQRPYVSLSDGGHFENMGLYEMVRRRCRFIVLSDGGADPGCTFGDLGECVRKIHIDFGIPIRFHELQALKPRPTDPTEVLKDVPYHAVAVIDYAAADGEEAERGILLYIKAGYHNCNEGAGIRAYANTHPTFPDESTLDQWFTEAQFESYRSLGFEIMDGILAEAQGCSTELAGLKEILTSLAADALREACEECDPPGAPQVAPHAG